ncbi:VWA domain-containing protein [Paenibacillus sp. GCM10027627]|uniref:VWA domain-containing protein n=1 Tax=unclassified Paenibacillus TaxID=185978 RepID=UPI003633C1DD
MQFLSMASAWFALALPAIALMYILKKTYRDTEVSSHLLWRRLLEEQEANKPWQRLRSRWLLLLQLFAALLLVLALMEPVVTKPPGSQSHAVLVIDRSGSMAFVPTSNQSDNGQKTTFQSAVAAAKEWINAKPKAQPVSIVASGSSPETLAAKLADRDKLSALLDELTPYYGATDNTSALSLADSLHQGDGAGYTVLFTDGRWEDAQDASSLILQAPLELVKMGGAAPPGNSSIQSFGVRADVSDPALQSISVTVRNDSGTEKEYRVKIMGGDDASSLQLLDELQLTVNTGEWGSAEASGLAPALFYKALIVSEGDGYLADNAAYAFPSIQQARKALLVTEGNMFLEKALILSWVQPVKTSPGGAPPAKEMAEEIDWILLDGISELQLEDPDWKALLDKKPLWIIDHPGRGGLDSVAPKHTEVKKKEHSVTSYLSFHDTHIGKMSPVDLNDSSWGEAILTYGDIPAIYAGEENGRPKLRYTFKLQDTDLPLRPEFPILILQSAQWMNGGSIEQLGTVTAGEPFPIPFWPETAKAEWEAVEHLSAEGNKQQGSGLGPLALDPSYQGASEAPAVPGLYRLHEWDVDGNSLPGRYLAVAAYAGEWAFMGEGQADLRLKTAASAESGNSEQARDITDRPKTQHASLQLWAAVLLIVVMALEWEVYRRGRSS